VAQGKTIIIVTHDSSLAKRTDRTALITDGEIVNEYVAKVMPALSREQLLHAFVLEADPQSTGVTFMAIVAARIARRTSSSVSFPKSDSSTGVFTPCLTSPEGEKN
jgi:ABC-type proline/glycine betaine transport system ATPase subunit